MIRKHVCLDGGEDRLGDEYDCPKCWAKLLESFSVPPEVPEPEPVTAPAGPLPHLVLPDSGRTVEINPTHTVAHGAQPYPDGRHGGIWRAVCSCGWRREGRYSFILGREGAEQTAQEAADGHMRSALHETTPLPEETHITNATVVPNTGRQGGVWRAACTCGWHEAGGYARDTGQTAAQRLAENKCQQHRENPEGQTT